MKYLSTNKKSPAESLKEAVLHGLAADGGLYLPTSIPTMEKNFWEKLKGMNFQEIAFAVAQKLIDGEIPDQELKEIITKAINFDAPLKQLSPEIYSLELFHGPTLAFKDFGARFMAQTMAYFSKDKKEKTYILAATSGDTGSAVGSAFLNLPGFEVIILYPSGKISNTQEKQLTTFGNNVTALEISGTFDDCQKLVKSAFTDDELSTRVNLSSANSINIARLIPQSFYYFYAFAQVKNPDAQIIFSVPTGNLGNLTAGIIAKKMGLPVKKFIAAQNLNNTFFEYLQAGKFMPHPSILTISNAMDVGNPSNFARLQELFNNDIEKVRKDICAYTINEAETISTMIHSAKNYGYTVDPHGAVGLCALEKYFSENPHETAQGIFLETAHPGKFFETVETAIGEKIALPKSLQETLNKEKSSIAMSSDFEDFKKFLLTLG